MKPIDITSHSYPEYSEDSDQKDTKFIVGDRLQTSKYKNIFAKNILKIGQKKFLFLVKFKIPFQELILLVI